MRLESNQIYKACASDVLRLHRSPNEPILPILTAQVVGVAASVTRALNLSDPLDLIKVFTPLAANEPLPTMRDTIALFTLGKGQGQLFVLLGTNMLEGIHRRAGTEPSGPRWFGSGRNFGLCALGAPGTGKTRAQV